MRGLGLVREGVFRGIGAVWRGLFSHANALTVRLYAEGTPVRTIRTLAGPIRFVCENPLTLWRATTFFKKEPDTLEWIDRMHPGDVLFDIGANVGLYTIYAAKRGVRVFAFEPESQNYALLNRNIYLNGLQDHVTALNVALSDRNVIDALYLSSMEKGASLHTVHSNVDFAEQVFAVGFRQGVLAATLDSLVEEWQLPLPTHIKMDVDGHESAIVHGAEKVLGDRNLQSVLVELNLETGKDRAVIDALANNGLRLEAQRQTTGGAGTRFAGVHNCIFVRAV